MTGTASSTRAIQLQTIDRRKSMPAKSKAQQAVMAIAEYDPSKLKKKSRGLLKMTHQQLHDFAATPTRKLPEHVRAGQRIIRKGK